jgi:putative transcriptional regulator
LARLRKERGYTQAELATKMGLIQALVSDYERGKLRLHADMVLRFAHALEVSTDELLGRTSGRRPAAPRTVRLLRRLQPLEELPRADQRAVLKFVDALLASRGRNGGRRRASA